MKFCPNFQAFLGMNANAYITLRSKNGKKNSSRKRVIANPGRVSGFQKCINWRFLDFFFFTVHAHAFLLTKIKKSSTSKIALFSNFRALFTMFSLIRITTASRRSKQPSQKHCSSSTEKNVIFQKDLDGQNLLEFDATIFRRQFIEWCALLQRVGS